MSFTVTFAYDLELEADTFPDPVHFRIEDNGVLVITDGNDVRLIAPHAWREVRTTIEPPDVL